ncbi:hypothetical protein ABK040_013781 [Willaertia magna]
MTHPTPTTQRSYSVEDFELGEQIGEGAYSRVVLSTFKPTGKKYALKIIKKQLIIKENKAKTVKIEKLVLNMMDHENIIKLFCTFQDKDNLYFALEFAPGGELFTYIKKYGPFSLEASQFYTAEIVNGMEYMHSVGVLHRDLKPENIILSKDMHVKITDFGTAKIKNRAEIEEETSTAALRRGTFCGTVQYVSPEILRDEPCSEGSDFWALGCIIYQFLSGSPPFQGMTEYLIMQKILKREFDYPENFPPVAKDIVEKLLQLDSNQRLGMGEDGYKKLKSHPFFEGIDFANLKNQTPPRIITKLSNAELEDHLGDFDCNNQDELNEKWNLFLLKNESIVYTRGVIKRRRLTSKKRQLILTDWPRLMYLDSDKMVVKGFIPLTTQVKVILKSNKDMIIRTPGRDYIIEDLSNSTQEWKQYIEKVITEKLGPLVD